MSEKSKVVLSKGKMPEKSMCDDSILANRTQAALAQNFYLLGIRIGRHPLVAMAIGFSIMVSGVPATFLLPGAANLLWVKMAAGFEPFSLTTTPQFRDREATNALHDGFFIPSHGKDSMIIISPKDPTAMPVFSHAFMQAALPLLIDIYAMQIGDGGTHYTFKDLCVPAGLLELDVALPTFALCLSASNDLFGAVAWNASAIPPAGAGAAQYGAGAHDYAAPLAGLGAVLDQAGLSSRGIFRSLVGMPTPPSHDDYRFWTPASLSVPFRLRDNRPAAKWVQALQSHVQSGRHASSATLRVTFLSDQSIGDGLQDLLDAFVPYLFLVFIVMGLYSELFLFSQTRTKRGEATQALLVLQGLVVSGLAGFSGMGWILYLGLNEIVILCCMAVFLVMAVGVDCTFIFVSAMRAADETLDVEEAMGRMLSEAATAISLTTSSSVVCFVAAGLCGASQPAFLKFNMTMAVALVINFCGFVFYFSGCMALNERRIAAGRADLRPWRPVTPGRLPAWSNVGQKLHTVIDEWYAPLFVESHLFKLGGLSFMLLSVALALVYVPVIGSGMAQTTFLVDSSALYETYADFERLGGGQAALSTTVQISGLDLTSDAALLALKTSFLDPIAARDEALSIACLPLSYLHYRNTTSGAGSGAILAWHDWLSASPIASMLYGHSYFPPSSGAAAPPTTIECSILHLRDVIDDDASGRISTMDAFYAIASDANVVMRGFGTSLRLSNFEWAIMTSLDKASSSLCWQGIAVAVLAVQAVLLFSLPLRRAVITAANILIVVFCVMGYVGYSGQSYHLLTLCVAAMGPGFCVDYTVEVMHFSNIGPRSDPMGTKFMKGMRACGYDVLHGCVTGMLGVGCLMMCPGEAPRLFGNVTMVMIFYGGVFALWSLPATLTLAEDAGAVLASRCCGSSRCSPAPQTV